MEKFTRVMCRMSDLISTTNTLHTQRVEWEHRDGGQLENFTKNGFSDRGSVVVRRDGSECRVGRGGPENIAESHREAVCAYEMHSSVSAHGLTNSSPQDLK
jgi:hypothetical protein